MNKNKVRNVLFIVMALILILSLIPDYYIYFTEYETPGDIYKCKYDSDEYQIIEGEKSACIVGKEETIFAIKSGQKWKIPHSERFRIQYMDNEDDVTVYVQEYNKLNDYYISIYSEDKNTVVSDNLDSEFIRVNDDFYTSCVTNPNESYVLYVNEEKHYIFK